MKLRTIPIFLGVFFLATSIFSFVARPGYEDRLNNRGYTWEDYDPAYFHKFQNVQSVIDEADQQLGIEKRKSLIYYHFIVDILRKRFYHGFSHYSFSENPLASMAGNFAWNHLSAIVIPDDIMKHPRAACSQQAIVLMEIFKRNGIDYRKVGLPNHYCVEAWIDGGWKFFDTNLEANISPESLESLISHQRLQTIYQSAAQDEKDLYQVFSNISYGPVNAPPAPQASLFHKLCLFLVSKNTTLILFTLILFYVFGLPERDNLVWSRRAVVVR